MRPTPARLLPLLLALLLAALPARAERFEFIALGDMPYGTDARPALLRRTFFSDPGRSLGAAPRAVESQAEVMGGAFSPHVENTRFTHGGVMVITAHVVGSGNNRKRFLSAATREYKARERANIAWLKDSFARAEREGARAIVLALQADMFKEEFDTPGHPEAFTLFSPYRDFGHTLKRLAARFERPVLLIYGDSHSFITALQVFGERDMHAVRVMIDTEDPAVFAFAPLLNPEKP